MVEAELLEISNMAWGNSIALVGLVITLISGYLIAAYIIGANITSSQSVIINILYIGFVSFLIISFFAFLLLPVGFNMIKFGYGGLREFTYRSLVSCVYLFSRGVAIPIYILNKNKPLHRGHKQTQPGQSG